MSSRFNKMSEELFQILKGSGKTLKLFDDSGNTVYEPMMARKFFAEPDKMMLSINDRDDDSCINLYLSQNTDIKAVADLVSTLRHVSTRYNVILDVKKYGKELTPKDFAYQAIDEAAMWGSTKTSYQKIGSAKLVVRHCAPIREDIMGSRARNILSIFIETKQGERFKFPVIHLSGARAWANHINEGGLPHDDMGQYIISLAQEGSDLTKVSRYIHYSRNTLVEEAQGVRGVVRCRISEVRKELQSLSRSRGYAKALEAKVYENKSIIKENRQEVVEQECQRLRELLSIDTNHALAEIITPVALITLGENIMTTTNTKFSQILALESVDDLIETLINEYGYEEGSHWSRHEAGLALLPEALEDVVGYLDLTETAYAIAEADEDKFVAFARSWFDSRNQSLAAAGEDPSQDGKTEAAIHDLAAGLKDIMAGKKPADVKLPDNMPGFANPVAAAQFKLGLFLDAGAKMQNDALWTFISAIVDKIQDSKKLSQIEALFAGKLINMVSTNESFDEADDMMESDPTSYEAGRAADADEAADLEIMNDFQKWMIDDFYKTHYSFLADQSPEGDPGVNYSDLKGDLNGFLDNTKASSTGDDYAEVSDSVVKYCMKIVVDDIKSRGWNIEDEITEGYTSNNASFKTYIEFNGDEEAEILVGYSDNDESYDIESIVLLATGQDIENELDSATIDRIHDTIRQDQAERHAEHLDRKDELSRERRLMGEDSFAVGDYVATDFGTGQIEELGRTKAKVIMTNGMPKVVHIADMSKAGPAEMPANIKELAEMEAWFEQFDPMSILTDIEEADKRKGLVGDVDASDSGMSEAREPMYHSVFELGDHGIWSQVFDADDAEDAKHEVDSLKSQGIKAIVIKVPKSRANWLVNKPDDFVKAHLASKVKAAPVAEEEVVQEVAAVPAHFEAGQIGMNDPLGFVAKINDNYGPTLARVASDVIEGEAYHEQTENSLAFLADVAEALGETALGQSLRDYLDKPVAESDDVEIIIPGDMGDDFKADVATDADAEILARMKKNAGL